MKQNTHRSIIHKHFLFLGLFLVFCSNILNAQSASGIALNWDVEVGCQTYFNEEDRKEIFLEDITDGVCLRVCESGRVTYNLTGLPLAGAGTVWSIAGGTISSQSSTSCTVAWGLTGAGSLTFTVNLPGGAVTKTLCFEKIIKPRAFFTRAPYLEETKYIFGCINQTINFVNYSTPNNGSNLISYFWDFGDGTYSTAFSPNHAYTQNGSYSLKLTVTNACNCTATYGRIVKISEQGFDISCPTVVCEKQQETYSLPGIISEECKDHYNWSSDGGEIKSIDASGNVTVEWNQVGPSGFGVLTFDPSECNSECLVPTTIRIPVIQNHGTITGDANVCVKQQNIYKLPQWPTTDFHWEVINNYNNSLAEVIPSEQRNEVVVKPLVAGAMILRCTYTNTMLGCGGTAEFIINVTAGQEFSGNLTLCAGTTGNYATTNGSPANWVLRNPAGNTINILNNSATYSYNFITAGGYTLSVGTPGTCPEQVKNITVVPKPATPLAASLTGSLTVCPNAPYIYSMPNDPAAQYYWAVTNGSILGSTVGNQVTVSFTGTTPAQLIVYKQSVSPIACASASLTIPITIKTIDAEIPNTNTTVCANSNANYQVNSTGTSTIYAEGETYTWSISPSTLGSITSGQNTNSIGVLWNNVTATTTATLTLTIKKCTLTKTITKTVTITPTPIIDIVASPNAACSGTPIQFTVVTTNGVPLAPGTVVTWNFGFGNTTGGVVKSFNFTNTSLANIGRNVTATISNANGCGAATNTASVQVIIYPGPSASASITAGGNVFCLESSINTILTAATATGATIQWFKAPSALGITTNTLNVNPHGFGEYYFVATNSNGCSTTSNSVFVSQLCPPQDNCIISPTPTLTNTSSNNCGVLNLVGTASGSPIFQNFDIIGPTSISGYTGSTLNVSAGNYHVFYQAGYLCQGEIVIRQNHKEITVPYVPRFNYTAICNNNSSFTVSVLDNSDFFTLVDNRSFQYSYRLGTSGPWTTSITTANGTITPNLAPGSYQIRLVIQGNLNGVPQPPCEIIVPMVLAAVPAQSITITTPPTCHDTAVRFAVTSPQVGDSYLWTFEPGAENTLSNPQRVFSSSGTKTVTVVITNKYGCSRTLTTTLTIPPPCFNGSVSSPQTTACLGTPVTINYTPGSGNCAVSNYVWMNGQDAIVGAPNAPTIQVYNPGFYWVRVMQGPCSYDTPQRITPTFKTPPSIKLSVPSAVCQGDEVVVKATTTATVIRWAIDGYLNYFYNNQTSITLTGLAVGTHTITATAYSGAPGLPTTCSEVVQQSVVVNPAPDEPVITQEIFCVDQDPAKPYYHVVLTATSNVAETFNWSNGMNGSPITVTNGGPYQVRVTNGGCSSKAQVDVPKNLEDYMWIFPTGCVTQCGRKEQEPTLIGPRLPFTFWEWTYNGNTELYGANSFPQPIQLHNSGTYNLALTQGDCSLQSLPLDYTVKACEKCDINAFRVRDIKKEEQKYCSYVVTLNWTSYNTYPATITAPNNDAVISPSGFTVLNGTNDYTFTVYPIGGFSGGPIHFQINGILSNGQPCITEFSITLPSCMPEQQTKNPEMKETSPSASFVLSPNPAKEQVTLFYKNLKEDSTVELYDLTGRHLAGYNIGSNEGGLVITTGNYPSGVYIVVVSNSSGLVSQQKLVLK